MPENIKSGDPFGIADGQAPSTSYVPSDDDKDTVQAVMGFFAKAYEHRLPYEREWELYRLYLKGEQLLLRDRETGEIVKLSYRDTKRLYSLNNQLRPTARSLIGKLSRMIPTFLVIPPTNDPDEVHGARVADSFFSYFRRKEKLDLRYLELNESITWCGTACSQLYWDPDGGQELAYCEECAWSGSFDLVGEPCPQCYQQLQETAALEMEAAAMEAEGGMSPIEETLAQAQEAEQLAQQPGPILQAVNEGDIRVRVLDTRDVFVEPGIERPEDHRQILVRTVEPISEIRRRFPQMANFVGAESSLMAEHTSRLSYSSVDNSTNFVEHMDEHAYLYEYHEMPSGKYPKGRVVWICNSLVLDEIESPYFELGRLPFFFAWWTRNPGEFWGESFIAQAWHRQKELNSLETQMREYAELVTRVRFLDPIGSRISSDEISATTGQRIKYNAGAGKPEFLVPPQMPAGIFNRQAQLVNDIREQAGVTAQEAGVTPTDPNGRAMAIIEAEADQQVGPITTRNIVEWGELHRGILILIKQFYSPDRKFTVGGEHSGSETYIFGEMNLQPGWDIQLELDDGLSRNQAVRLNQVMEMMNANFFTNAQTGVPDFKQAARLAKVKIPSMGPDLTSTEYSAAMELVKKMEVGEAVEPGLEDDPMIFSEVLLGWLRGKGRKADPNLREMVRQAYMFYTSWA